jgi:hypothetical protein
MRILMYMLVLLANCFWTIIYASVAIYVGMILLKRIAPAHIKKITRLERINYSFLIGLGAISFILMGLGLAGLFRKWIIVSLLAVFGLLAIRDSIVHKRFRNILKLLGRARSILSLPIPWIVILAIIVCGIASLALFTIVRPVSGDAEAFYFTQAKLIAYSEKIVPLRNWFSFAMIGFFGELHFAALLSVSGWMAAKFLIWFAYLSISSTALSFCRFFDLDFRGKLVTQSLLIFSTIFIEVANGGKIDLFAASLGFALFLFILRYDFSWTCREYSVAGFLLGFSTLAKLSYIPVMYPCFIFFFVGITFYKGRKIEGRSLAETGIGIAAILLFSIVPFIPHIIKNSLLFKEPFAPFLYFHGKPAFDVLGQSWYSPETIRYLVLTYPFQLFYGRFPGQGGTLSPMILALLPLGLYGCTKERTKARLAWIMLLTGLLCIAVWVNLRPGALATRYILAPLLLFVPIAGCCVSLVGNGKSATWASIVAMLVLIFGCVIYVSESSILTISKKAIRTLMKCTTGKSLYADSIQFLNDTVPEGERVSVWGFYTFYFREDILATIEGSDDATRAASTKEELLLRLAEGSFKYIYVENAASSPIFDDLSGHGISKIFSGKRATIYRVDLLGRKVLPKAIAKRNSRGKWYVENLR